MCGMLRRPEQSISSAVGFRAKTSASRELARVLKENEAAFGLSLTDAFAWYDLDSRSWKTLQRCLNGEWDEYSETWPRAGMMRNGTVYLQQPLAPLTDVIGFSLLPTPLHNDGPGYYVATLKSAVARIGRREHWVLDAIFYKGLKKGWANPRFQEAMMGLPIGWTDLL